MGVNAIPWGSLPRGVCDPSIMLGAVPALPKISRQRLGSKERLSGKYKEARTTSFTAMTRLEAKPWPTARRWGLPLFAQAPLVLPPLFQALFSPAQRTSVVRQRPERTWYSHPMLVVHLVDEAPRTAKTTGEVLQGLLATDISYHIYRQPADVVLDLSAPASHDLLRWLCAVLAPGLGWRVVGGRPTRWTTCGSSGVSVSFVLTDELISFDANQQPPDSSRAIELLIEFYALFGLEGANRSRGSRHYLDIWRHS